jgi:hypothetical protein
MLLQRTASAHGRDQAWEPDDPSSEVSCLDLVPHCDDDWVETLDHGSREAKKLVVVQNEPDRPVRHSFQRRQRLPATVNTQPRTVDGRRRASTSYSPERRRQDDAGPEGRKQLLRDLSFDAGSSRISRRLAVSCAREREQEGVVVDEADVELAGDDVPEVAAAELEGARLTLRDSQGGGVDRVAERDREVVAVLRTPVVDRSAQRPEGSRRSFSSTGSSLSYTRLTPSPIALSTVLMSRTSRAMPCGSTDAA